MAEATTTTDHDEIRRWAEEHGGKPARVTATGDAGGEPDPGILRIDFGGDDEGLEEISWDEWFQAFDDNQLAFLHGDGDDSRFNKLVAREG